MKNVKLFLHKSIKYKLEQITSWHYFENGCYRRIQKKFGTIKLVRRTHLIF